MAEATPKTPAGRVSAGVAWVARHWLLAAIAAVGLYATLPVAAPALAMAGHDTTSGLIYAGYRVACHQMPHHSWFVGGPSHTLSWPVVAKVHGVDPSGSELAVVHRPIRSAALGYQVAVCQRDLAIYWGVLVVAMLYAAVGRGRRPLSLKLYALALVPIALDGGTALLGLRDSTPLLRTVTGALFGAASALLVLPYLDLGMREIEADHARYRAGDP